MGQSVRNAKIFGDKEDPRERLRDLFGGDRSTAGQPPATAVDWARRMLDEHPTTDITTAVAILRRAEPRLTLKAATFLAKDVLRG